MRTKSGWLFLDRDVWGEGNRRVEGTELEQTDERSHYSSFGDIIPALGAAGRSNRAIVLPPFFVSPFDPRYRAWQNFLVFLVFYTAWMSPFEFGFLPKPWSGLSIIDNVLNGLFFVDIILTFFVAYQDKSTYLLVDNRRKITFRYMKSGFFLDLISTIPSELGRLVLPSKLQSYGYFSLLRLWRLVRVSRFFSRLEKDINLSYFLIRCVKLICVTLFMIHVCGCIFYRLASTYHNPQRTWIGSVWPDFKQKSLWVRYVTSLYWSITTLTTTGYGDLHPVNSGEMVFVIICMFLDLALTSYLIGNMTNLVVHSTFRTRQYRDTIRAARSFCKRNTLPIRLQDQMISHLSLKFRADSEGLYQQETLNALPKAIQSNIVNFLFYTLVDKVYLFRGLSNDLLFQLVSEMKAEYYPPKEDVILKNETPTDIYILVNGAVELVAVRNGVEQVEGEAKCGDVVGEIGVLCYKPQPFTVRTKKLSQLLRLSRTSFLTLVQAHYGDGTIIMNNFLQHLKENRTPEAEEILANTSQMLAGGDMGLPLPTCFAAESGDHLLLQKLLEQKADPDEADSSGRTALHIAASNGYAHCVALLLEFGANPNKRDSEGNVPLWEALVGKHNPVAKLLIHNGANINYGDVGQYAVTATTQNNYDLLYDIASIGGDVSARSNQGTTALHKAVSQCNLEIVRFLLQHGADPDTPDDTGSSARDIADFMGDEEIKTLIRENKDILLKLRQTQQETPDGVPVIKQSKEDTVARYPRPQVGVSGCQHRRRFNDYQNSLFGVLSAANPTNAKTVLESPGSLVRVAIRCSDESDARGKLIRLPMTMDELLQIGARHFGVLPTRVLSEQGDEIDDIELIRDGDRLVLVCEERKRT